MGESKRRKEALGEDYGKSEPVFSKIPFWTKAQASQFVKITTQASWIGIGLTVAIWVTVRFIGPGFGWWHLAE
ncbi:MAG: DUF2839 domain-containing protein [Pseudanabaenaceae cyanobacterium]|jgi:hypothetical protein